MASSDWEFGGFQRDGGCDMSRPHGDHCKKGLSVSSKSTQMAPKQDRLEKVAVSDKRPLTGLIRDRGRSRLLWDEGLGVTSHTGVARASFVSWLSSQMLE